MKNSRYKPVGWRGDSHRHYLARKGVSTSLRNPRTVSGRFVERLLAEREAKRRVGVEFAGVEDAQRLAVEKQMLRGDLSDAELKRQKEIIEELRAPRRVGERKGGGVSEDAYDFLAKNESERKVRLAEVKAKLSDVLSREQEALSLKDEEEKNRVLPKVLAEKNDLLDERRKLEVEILRTQREMRKVTRSLRNADIVVVRNG